MMVRSDTFHVDPLAGNEVLREGLLWSLCGPTDRESVCGAKLWSVQKMP